MLQVSSSDLFHIQRIESCICIIASENNVPSYSSNDLFVAACVRNFVAGKVKLAFSLLN